MAETKVVTAVGVSSNVSARTAGKMLGSLIQRAMADAVLECTAEGISTEEKNSEIIKDRMMKARQRVLDEYNRLTAAPKSEEDK